MAKKELKDMIVPGLLILAVAYFLNVGGVGTWMDSNIFHKEGPATGGTTLPPTGTGGTGGTTPTKCYIADTTLTVGNAERWMQPTTKATTAYHQVFLNGVDKAGYKDGSTLTVAPGDKIEMIWAWNDTTYYSAKQSFTVPCSGAVIAGAQPDSDAYKLYAMDGQGLGAYTYNDDGQVLNKWSNASIAGNTFPYNVSAAAGDAKTVEFKLVGTYGTAYSPYGSVIASCDYNKTGFIQKLVLNDENGNPFPTASTPASHTTPLNWGTASFKLPSWKNTATLKGSMYYEIVSSYSGGKGQNVTCHLYDEEWYQDYTDGKYKFGVEDVSNGITANSNVGITNANEWKLLWYFP